MARNMIRDITTRDIPFMVKEGREFFKYTGMHKRMEYKEDHVADFLEKTIGHPTMKMLVADRDDELTAFIGGMVGAPFYNLEYPILMEFIWWTSETGRGNGDGIRVLKKLEQWALSVGAKGSVMEVIDNHLANASASMLRRMGYSIIEHRFMKELVN